MTWLGPLVILLCGLAVLVALVWWGRREVPLVDRALSQQVVALVKAQSDTAEGVRHLRTSVELLRGDVQRLQATVADNRVQALAEPLRSVADVLADLQHHLKDLR